MIISKKKYDEAIKAAENEAEARTALRMHQRAREEEKERKLDERFISMRRSHDLDMNDLSRQMRLMDERLRKLEQGAEQRGKHERI